MSVASVVMVCLMAFVLLAPTLMVAVLVSGLSRRPETTEDAALPDLDIEPQVALRPAS